MDTVPQIISVRDLFSLKQSFNQNLILWKQLRLFLEQVEDEEIRELFHSLMVMHYNHLQLILSIIKGERRVEEGSNED